VTLDIGDFCTEYFFQFTSNMQNPSEDTEWNDILRSKGIIPPKEKEISEDQIVSMLEETIEKKKHKMVKN